VEKVYPAVAAKISALDALVRVITKKAKQSVSGIMIRMRWTVLFSMYSSSVAIIGKRDATNVAIPLPNLTRSGFGKLTSPVSALKYSLRHSWTLVTLKSAQPVHTGVLYMLHTGELRTMASPTRMIQSGTSVASVPGGRRITNSSGSRPTQVLSSGGC
jgi:hypothetical protein